MQPFRPQIMHPSNSVHPPGIFSFFCCRASPYPLTPKSLPFLVLFPCAHKLRQGPITASSSQDRCSFSQTPAPSPSLVFLDRVAMIAIPSFRRELSSQNTACKLPLCAVFESFDVCPLLIAQHSFWNESRRHRLSQLKCLTSCSKFTKRRCRTTSARQHFSLPLKIRNKPSFQPRRSVSSFA